MGITRRRFMSQTAGAAAGGLVVASASPRLPATPADDRPLIVSTWPFGKRGNGERRRLHGNRRKPAGR